MALSFGRKKTQKASEYEVVLNLRGRARQFGKRTFTGLKSSGKQSFMIILVTLVLFLLFTVINTSFASTDNLLAMVKSLVPYAMLGLGVTFVIATGGIDLSIGTVCIAVAVMAGTICRTTTSVTAMLWLTIPLMLIFGLAFGLLNGFLVAKLKLPPFIATLGTMMFARGLSAIIVNAPNVFFPTGTWYNRMFSNLNDFPIGLVWIVGLAAICFIVMFKTRVGRYILSIGSNEEATRLSGVRVDKYKMIAFTLSGMFAGIAAIFWSASFTTVASATGNGMELDAIAGVYIGGTSASGGVASVIGSVIGSLILVVIRNGLNLTLAKFNVAVNSTYLTYVITGIIVVVAVLLDVVKNRNLNRVRTEKKAKKYREDVSAQIEALRTECDYIRSDRSMTPAARAERIRELHGRIGELRRECAEKLPALKAEDAAIAAERKKMKLAAKSGRQE